MLLLDEPFGALDAKVRKELRRWLRQLHDELHITSVFVTPRPGGGARGRRPRGADEPRRPSRSARARRLRAPATPFVFRLPRRGEPLWRASPTAPRRCASAPTRCGTMPGSPPACRRSASRARTSSRSSSTRRRASASRRSSRSVLGFGASPGRAGPAPTGSTRGRAEPRAHRVAAAAPVAGSAPVPSRLAVRGPAAGPASAEAGR